MKVVCSIAILLLPHLAGAQGQLVSGEFMNLPFDEFVLEVEEQIPVKFIFKKEWTKDIYITAKGDSMELQQVLASHFEGKDLFFYFYHENRIFITHGEPLVMSLPDYQQKDEDPQNQAYFEEDRALTETEILYIEGRRKVGIRTLTVGDAQRNMNGKSAIINGTIHDMGTGEALVGATIFIQELSKGFITDINGHFTLTIPPGTYNAQFNCLGMEEINYYLDVGSDGDLSIEMESKLYPIDEITVKSDNYHNVRGLEMGFTQLSMKNIKEIPVVMGERDVLKVVQMLPGVQNAGEGSAGIYVRGSAADQNMFIFNNIPVYNPSHFFGFFSAFNSDIIRDFSIYKSNLPAKYGGKLASVIDISTRQGSNKAYTARGGISPVTAHVVAEGPVIQDRISFIISARATYSDWLLKRIQNSDFHHSNARFHDFAGGINIKLNDKNLLKSSAYYSYDQFSLASNNTNQYSNAGASLIWWHQLSSILSSDASLLFSQYTFEEKNNSLPLEAYHHKYTIKHYEFKNDYKWIPGPKHSVTFGGNVILYDLDRGSIDPLGVESDRKTVQLGSEKGMEAAIHISDQFQISERLTLYGGMRYSFFNYFGPQTVYQYEPDNPLSQEFVKDTLQFSDGESVRFYSGPEWRTSLNYLTGSNSSVKLSYNKTRQYLYMLSNTISIAPIDQWKLSDYHIKPAAADQISIGYYYDFTRKDINLSTEVYYKKVKNIVDYVDGASFILSPDVETMVLQGIQRAYGLEFLLKKNAGKFNGWLSFTYSRSFIKVDGANSWDKINMGNWYPANYDIPVSINSVMTYRLNRRLSFSGNFIYHTGRPITYPTSQFHINERNYVSYSGRNEFRIPDYFRIDLSFNLEGNLEKRKLAHSFWTLNIYNLTGRKNAYSVFFKYEEGQLNGYKMSIFSQPIVTLSWNFKFGNYASD